MIKNNTLEKIIQFSCVYFCLYLILFFLLPLILLISGTYIPEYFTGLEPASEKNGYLLPLLSFYLHIIKPFESPASAIFAVSLAIITIKISGSLSDFYSKITGFGIIDVRVNRKGQDSNLTKMWIDRIKDSEEVIICGTSCRGWFVKANEELREILSDKDCKIQTIRIYILDPFGGIWRVRINKTGYNYGDFIEQYQNVISSLSRLAEDYKGRVKIYFYDTEPASFVKTESKIYYALYFPFAERKYVPELTLSTGGYLGLKLNKEILENMPKIQKELNSESLSKYHDTLMSLYGKEREYSKIENLDCDFCKEPADLPTTFSRKYINCEKNGEKSKDRIIKSYDNFYLIPTLGQITDDYVLIVSNIHITASSQLSLNAHKELRAIKNSIEVINREKNKETLFFEHGMPYFDKCFGGCGLSHMHIHAVPITLESNANNFLDKVKSFLESKSAISECNKLASWADLQKYWNTSYISVEVTGNCLAFTFQKGCSVESQLMRKFLVDHFNNSKWDWREYDNEYERIISIKSYFGTKL